MMIRYFDQAATSWPKPDQVVRAVVRTLEEAGGNPGRSGHELSIAASRAVESARSGLSRLLEIPDPSRLVFTRNVTESLNIALKGLLRPGDRVVTTGLEHNATMRPLRALERRGVEVSVVPVRPDSTLDLDRWEAALRQGARLAAFLHASNVTGTILPAAEMVGLAHRHGALALIDAAQSAGHLPVSAAKLGADMLALTGHKGLLGPQGTGALYVAPGVDLPPLIEGGTGSLSEREEQPAFYPDHLESGTPNTPGLAGLGAGVELLAAEGIDRIRAGERDMTGLFLDGLRQIDGLVLHGPCDPSRQVGVISVTVAGADPADVSLVLQDRYGILTRPGLHCAPAAHRSIGTWPVGTVRFSLDYRHTPADIAACLDALSDIGAAVREAMA